MAKGGKGRKGGGGGGGKTRKYSRDNKGRFASTGSGGATAQRLDRRHQCRCGLAGVSAGGTAAAAPQPGA